GLLRSGEGGGGARRLLRRRGQRGHPYPRWRLRRRRRWRQGLLRPYAAGRRGLAPGRPGQGRAGLQGALGPARLPAALGPPPGVKDGPGAGDGGRREGRRVRAGGHELGDAGDRAHLRQPLPLEDRARAAVEDRQQGKEDARRLPAPGWLWHHREGPALPAAADRRRGTAAVWQGWAAEVRRAEERDGG